MFCRGYVTGHSRPPQVGEMVLVGEDAGYITRVIGSINGHWWVQTSAVPYGVVQGLLYDWGHERLWAAEPHDG